jgi:CBS domain-containing protein
MKVSDVTTLDVITGRADTTVDEIVRLSTEHRINAAPAEGTGRAAAPMLKHKPARFTAPRGRILEGIASRADILRSPAKSE